MQYQHFTIPCVLNHWCQRGKLFTVWPIFLAVRVFIALAINSAQGFLVTEQIWKKDQESSNLNLTNTGSFALDEKVYMSLGVFKINWICFSKGSATRRSLQRLMMCAIKRMSLQLRSAGQQTYYLLYCLANMRKEPREECGTVKMVKLKSTYIFDIG